MTVSVKDAHFQQCALQADVRVTCLQSAPQEIVRDPEEGVHVRVRDLRPVYLCSRSATTTAAVALPLTTQEITVRIWGHLLEEHNLKVMPKSVNDLINYWMS